MCSRYHYKAVNVRGLENRAIRKQGREDTVYYYRSSIVRDYNSIEVLKGLSRRGPPEAD